MGNLMNTLQSQLKTEQKKDAEECIQLYNYLFEFNNGKVWSSQWQSLVIVKFVYQSNERYYKLNHLGKLVLKGLNDEKISENTTSTAISWSIQ